SPALGSEASTERGNERVSALCHRRDRPSFETICSSVADESNSSTSLISICSSHRSLESRKHQQLRTRTGTTSEPSRLSPLDRPRGSIDTTIAANSQT